MSLDCDHFHQFTAILYVQSPLLGFWGPHRSQPVINKDPATARLITAIMGVPFETLIPYAIMLGVSPRAAMEQCALRRAY